MRPILTGLIFTAMLAGHAVAGETPKKTVAQLDIADPKYATEHCEEARTKASGYSDHNVVRTAVTVGGNLVLPFAGAAAGTALGLKLDKKKDKLNRKLATACVSDPLNEEIPLILAPAAVR
ncbi:hypothetical protein ASD79_15505 [Caulobacter sp. Root655]|uniref:hypothetical protein n=1 Tax=Caulobacter sp. Root655 TaxID=1736578 RepID=UPI0006FF682F|nr:hypothetical protein [Caulobacter sp. Root655]KRA57724.1 hypothetical protein ASD79_15505 [Caulobacter sp. Root655]